MSGPVVSDQRDESPGGELEPQVPPGRQGMLLASLSIGVLLLGLQLWFLTVALDLFLSGEQSSAWVLAVLSGVVFGGGLLAQALLGHAGPRRP